MPEPVSLVKAIEAGRLHAHGVSEYLDRLDIDQVIELLGEPRKVTTYAGGEGGQHWRVGQDRPLLADDDPAVQQAIAHCGMSRIRGKNVPDFVRSIHPVACRFCEKPLDELLAAGEWATHEARYVDEELLVWDGEGGSTYLRPSGVKGYLSPEHIRFWAQSREMRAHRIAVAAGTAETPALAGGV